MIPGSNILNQALTLISSNVIEWYKFSGRALNEIGLYEDQYDPPIEVIGSFQPVDKMTYQELGLDFKEIYARFYTSNNVLGLDRNYSGDYFVFDGDRYVVKDEIHWYQIDGWNSLLLVKAPLGNI